MIGALPDLQTSDIFTAIFDQLSDAILIYDPSLRVKAINKAAEGLLDMTAAEIVGKHCHDIFRCQVCEPSCGMLIGLDLLQPTPTSTVRLHTVHGTERVVVVRTTQIKDDEGQLTSVVAAIKDISKEVAPQKRAVVAESRVMADMMRFVRRVAASEASTILLEGENGVGKDLIAKTLHYESARQSEPFIPINCAAIPETLLESELFGYERGAFTDAKAQKRGIFELADGGTLFLDEVGEIPVTLQVKLLRVLEDQTFRRLGGLKDITINVRVIAATNKDLREAVREGAFRQDLYFRLNVIQITIPPLRERRDDVLALASFFIDQYNNKFKRQVEGLSPEAASLLIWYDWPGNVRELRNAIERAMILEDQSNIRAESLPLTITGKKSPLPTQGEVAAGSASPLPDEGISLVENERLLLKSALEKTNGNQTQAARLLKITRDTLRYKMKKYDL